MVGTHETINIADDAQTFIVDFSIENKSKAIIIGQDKDKFERIKRTLLFCIKMSSTEGGEHKLKFTIRDVPKSFLSLYSSNNKLLMEGDILQGLSYIKKFLSEEKYIQAIGQLNCEDWTENSESKQKMGKL